jgi:hypothetical protein
MGISSGRRDGGIDQPPFNALDPSNDVATTWQQGRQRRRVIRGLNGLQVQLPSDACVAR